MQRHNTRLPAAFLPDYVSAGLKGVQAGLSICPQQRKRSSFPGKPLSVHFSSWLPHPLPTVRGKDSGRAYLGTVMTCYILNDLS